MVKRQLAHLKKARLASVEHFKKQKLEHQTHYTVQLRIYDNQVLTSNTHDTNNTNDTNDNQVLTSDAHDTNDTNDTDGTKEVDEEEETWF